MVTAIVLINVSQGEINNVAEKLVTYAGISEVYSVAGRYDLAAVIRVNKNEDLADLIASEMLMISGIENTETLIAFRAYSKHDLEQMFEVGFN
jgi:DNA-binding Lrp family transcriptional regulator